MDLRTALGVIDLSSISRTSDNKDFLKWYFTSSLSVVWHTKGNLKERKHAMSPEDLPSSVASTYKAAAWPKEYEAEIDITLCNGMLLKELYFTHTFTRVTMLKNRLRVKFEFAIRTNYPGV